MWKNPSQPSLFRYTFTSSTNWTVPLNVKSAYISIAGGGAGGISGNTGSATTSLVSGSSGGFLISYPLNLIPGEIIPITIGAGGEAGLAPNGGVGHTTMFGSYLSCTGALESNPAAEAQSFPGSCGTKGGMGVYGQYVETYGGWVSGGNTPLGYGSGGRVFRCNNRYSCPEPNATIGYSGTQGVVIIDVLY